MTANNSQTSATVEIDIGNQNKESSGGYYCNDTQQINILLVGRTQTGKSTILEALKDPEYQKTDTGFSVTREPQCHRKILIDEYNKQAYQLNVIDTPGLNEKTRVVEDSRSNSELLNLARLCIEGSVTTLNVVCFVSQAGRTHQFDLDTFGPLMEFLGPEWSPNSMMILTHSDGFTMDKLASLEQDIKTHKESKVAYEYCKLGVFYHGILNHDDLATYDHDPDLRSKIMESKMKHLISMRKRLIKAFIDTAKCPRQITQLQEIARASAEDRQRAVDEALKKHHPRCRVM